MDVRFSESTPAISGLDDGLHGGVIQTLKSYRQETYFPRLFSTKVPVFFEYVKAALFLGLPQSVSLSLVLDWCRGPQQKLPSPPAVHRSPARRTVRPRRTGRWMEQDSRRGKPSSFFLAPRVGWGCTGPI